VGYGDQAPETGGGRLVTAAAAAFLIGVFTLPAGVISSGFVEFTDRARLARKAAVVKLEQVYRRRLGRKMLRHWFQMAGLHVNSPLSRQRSRLKSTESETKSPPLTPLPDSRMPLSRAEELRRICLTDPELAAVVGGMNRAQLRRLVAALGVLKACDGDEAAVFRLLSQHLRSVSQQAH
jgi:hypothetical protein